LFERSGGTGATDQRQTSERLGRGFAEVEAGRQAAGDARGRGTGAECDCQAHSEHHRWFRGSEPIHQHRAEGYGRFSTPRNRRGGEWGYGGRNIAFGVREHAMGAAVNGMAAHGGLLPFSATFLVFSDYMKPSIRLGALSKLKAFYVFTHDSIGVGEDGPTH